MTIGRQWQKSRYRGGGAFLKAELSVRKEQGVHQHEKAKCGPRPALSVWQTSEGSYSLSPPLQTRDPRVREVSVLSRVWILLLRIPSSTSSSYAMVCVGGCAYCPAYGHH